MNWFAIVSKPQHEFAVAAALRDKDYEVFVPYYQSSRRWSDRRKIISVPLFPRYSFCKFSWEDRVSILRTQGVQSVLSFSGQPTPVADEEIEGIRRMVDSGVPLEPWTFLQAGAKVRVTAGPLSGVEGIVVRRAGGSCLVLSVSLLQRSVAAVVRDEDVLPETHSEGHRMTLVEAEV